MNKLNLIFKSIAIFVIAFTLTGKTYAQCDAGEPALVTGTMMEYKILNCTQPTSKSIKFDLYATNLSTGTAATQQLKLAGVTVQITISSSIFQGGVPSSATFTYEYGSTDADGIGNTVANVGPGGDEMATHFTSPSTLQVTNDGTGFSKNIAPLMAVNTPYRIGTFTLTNGTDLVIGQSTNYVFTTTSSLNSFTVYSGTNQTKQSTISGDCNSSSRQLTVGCNTTIQSLCTVPQITSCPGNKTVNNTAGLCSATVTFDAADASGTSPVISYSPVQGSSFNVGTTTVTVSADNACGHDECTFTVTVVDNETPTITCPSDVTTCSATPSLGTPTNLTDNCAGSLTLTNDAPSSFNIGTSVVTWTVTDTHGNSNTCAQNVMVNNCNCPNTATLTASTAICQTAVSTVKFNGSGGTVPYTFTYHVVDVNGNVGSDQTVTTTGTNAYVTVPLLTGDAGTVTYILTAVADGSCSAGVNLSKSVLIKPAPVLVVTPATQALCGSTTAQSIQSLTVFDANSLATVYNWTRTNANLVSDDNSLPTTGAIGLAMGSSISGQLKNILTSQQTSTFTIKATALGCTSSKTATVVAPLPTATIKTSAVSVCKDASSPTITFTGAGGTVPYTFVYSINGTPQAPVQSILTTATVQAPTDQDGSFVYAIISVTDNNGCTVPSLASVTQTIKPLPVATATPDNSEVCSGGKTSVVLGQSNPNVTTSTTYTWTATATDPSDGTITFTDHGSGTTIAQVLSNSSNLNTGTVTYSITPKSNSCAGEAITASVTVKPLPAITATVEQELICSGSEGHVDLAKAANSIDIDDYKWTTSVSLASGASGCAGACDNFIENTLYSTKTTDPGVVTYKITPIGNNGCAGVVTNAVINIKPKVDGKASPATLSLCSGENAVIDITSTTVSDDPVIYSWHADETTLASNGNMGFASNSSGYISSPINELLTLIPAGPGTVKSGVLTYTITPKANGCIGTPFTSKVTVKPLPEVSISSGNTTICSGVKTGLVLTSNVSGTTYIWTASQTTTPQGGSLLFTASSNGTPNAQIITNDGGTTSGVVTYTITPTAALCTGADVSATVTVNPVATVTVTNNLPSICSVSSTNIDLSSPVAGTTFAWTAPSKSATYITGGAASSGSNISQIITDTSRTISGTATYTITPTANGCKGTPNTATVTVFPKPNPVSIIATPTDGSNFACDASVTFTASNIQNDDGTGSPVTYLWSTSSSTVAPIHNGVNNQQTVTIDFNKLNTAVTITLKAYNSCGTTYNQVTKSVSGLPLTIDAIDGETSPCQTQAYQYSVHTQPGSATSYVWTKPAGSIFTDALGNAAATPTGPTAYLKFSTAAVGASLAIKVTAKNSCGVSGAPSPALSVTISGSCRTAVPDADITSATALTELDAVLYPNPASEKITLLFNSNQPQAYTISLLDMTGRRVLYNKGTSVEGFNKVELNLANLPKGIYLVNFTTGDQAKTIRMVVE